MHILHCIRCSLELCLVIDECVLFHTVPISLFHHLPPSFYSWSHSPLPSCPPFLSASLIVPVASSLLLPVTLSLTFTPSWTFPLLFLILPRSPPSLPNSLSVSDRKQVLFSLLVSSFLPSCFVALVSEWRVCGGILKTTVGVGDK